MNAPIQCTSICILLCLLFDIVRLKHPPSSGLSVIILETGCPLGERGPCLTKGSWLPKVLRFSEPHKHDKLIVMDSNRDDL